MTASTSVETPLSSLNVRIGRIPRHCPSDSLIEAGLSVPISNYLFLWNAVGERIQSEA